jgi:putative ABC transport system permease protein
MPLIRQLARGLRVLFRRRDADRELHDEIEHYLEEAAAVLVERGLTPDEARRAARLEAGSVTRLREQVRDGGWENLPGSVLSDLRYGARRLRANPGFTIVAVLTLALGIGASATIFSAVKPTLLEPLPYPQPDRILAIWDTGRAGRADVTFGTYREVVERSRAFDAIAVMRPWQPTLAGLVHPERLDGQRVSADYFRALGVLPVFGRTFTPDEDRVRGPRVVVVGHRLWQRRWGGDPTLVGRTITLDENHYTVVGVMPSWFENVVAPAAEIWTPLQYDRSLPLDGREWGHHLQMIGRLRPSVGIGQAIGELDTIARNPVPSLVRAPWAALDAGFIVTTLQEDVARVIKPALLAVVGAVALVLVIACVNVTSLLLSRSARVRDEFAMRAALGAPRWRLIAQTLTETLLLSGLGGALGLLAAAAGVRALLAVAPAGLPRVSAIEIDGFVFAFALALTALVGVAVGVIPAVTYASGAALQTAIQRRSGRLTGGRRIAGRALIVVEVALALVLLVGAGLLLRSVQRLFAIPPGFDPAHLLTMQVQTAGTRFRDPVVAHRFFAEALDAVRRVPGVAAAAMTSQLPLSGDFSKYGIVFESIPVDSREEDGAAFRYGVTPGYFEAMRIPLRRGRVFDERDRAGAANVAIINESFARRKFGDRDPIGQRVRVGSAENAWSTIVGLTGDVKQVSLAASDADAAYVPTTQWYFVDDPLWLVVRLDAGRPPQPGAIVDAIWSVDRNQPVVRVAMMATLVEASAAEQRFALLLFEMFGGAALLLAAIGIYGVLSGSVKERTREIGIRTALGAPRAANVALVLRDAMALAGVGVAIGVVVAAGAAQSLAALLFGVGLLDATTYVGVISLLLGVAATAAALPAARAARVDPAITLRMD